MAGEWQHVALGDVSINHDALRRPVRRPDRALGPYPYYGASGVVDYVDGYIFDGEYLLVAEDGENLRTRQTPVAFLAQGRFWVNNHAHIISGGTKALTRFLHYALVAADIDPFLTGAVMPKLTQASLTRIPILLPPLRDQEQLVEILGSLDDKIEFNRRIAGTLETMARALFKSWFVDFGPVRAKAEGRPTGLPDDVAALFPDSFGGDGFPEGWTSEPIGHLFDIRGGNTPSTGVAEYWNGSHYWATPKDLSNLSNPVLIETQRHLTDHGLAQSTSSLLPPSSLLLSTRAPIGYLAFNTHPTAINQGFAGFVRKETSPAFAWLWCLANMDVLKGNAGGSTFPEVSKGLLRKLSMVSPPTSVRRAFDTFADSIVVRIIASSTENQTLAALRDTLLPKLISGELRIEDAAAEVSAV